MATPRIDSRALVVLAAGLGSSALAFLGVWQADRAGEHILGWYGMVWGLLPVPAGAVLVGLVASLGYGAASYLTQRKVTGALLWTMVLLLAGSYLAAQYVEYRVVTSGLGDEALGFFDYFDKVTRALAWQESPFGGAGRPEALEEWGYALRALEIAGFVGGGLIVPAALRKKPYCDACRCYRQSKLVAIVPAVDDELGAHRRFQIIMSAARTGSFDEIAHAIVTHGPLSGRQQSEDGARWLTASLLYCPSCADGAIISKSHHRTRQAGRRILETQTGAVPLENRLVREFLDVRAKSGHPYR